MRASDRLPRPASSRILCVGRDAVEGRANARPQAAPSLPSMGPRRWPRRAAPRLRSPRPVRASPGAAPLGGWSGIVGVGDQHGAQARLEELDRRVVPAAADRQARCPASQASKSGVNSQEPEGPVACRGREGRDVGGAGNRDSGTRTATSSRALRGPGGLGRPRSISAGNARARRIAATAQGPRRSPVSTGFHERARACPATKPV